MPNQPEVLFANGQILAVQCYIDDPILGRIPWTGSITVAPSAGAATSTNQLAEIALLSTISSQLASTLSVTGSLSVTPIASTTAGPTLRNGAGQTLDMALAGNIGVGVTVAFNVYTGQVRAFVSFDLGASWFVTSFADSRTGSMYDTSLTLVAESNTNHYSLLIPAGTTNVRWEIPSYTSGDFTVSMRGNNIPFIPTYALGVIGEVKTVAQGWQIGGAASAGGEFTAAKVTTLAPIAGAAGLVVRSAGAIGPITDVIPISSDGLGNALAMRNLTSGGVSDPAVRTDAPVAADRGIIVRNIPSGTQPVSGTLSATVSGTVSITNTAINATVTGSVALTTTAINATISNIISVTSTTLATEVTLAALSAKVLNTTKNRLKVDVSGIDDFVPSTRVVLASATTIATYLARDYAAPYWGSAAISFGFGTLVGTVVVEGIGDSATGIWVPLQLFNETTGVWSASIVNPVPTVLYRCNAAGFSAVRARCSIFFSGSVSVEFMASPQPFSATPANIATAANQVTELATLNTLATQVTLASIDGKIVTGGTPSRILVDNSGIAFGAAYVGGTFTGPVNSVVAAMDAYNELAPYWGGGSFSIQTGSLIGTITVYGSGSGSLSAPISVYNERTQTWSATIVNPVAGDVFRCNAGGYAVLIWYCTAFTSGSISYEASAAPQPFCPPPPLTQAVSGTLSIVNPSSQAALTVTVQSELDFFGSLAPDIFGDINIFGAPPNPYSTESYPLGI